MLIKKHEEKSNDENSGLFFEVDLKTPEVEHKPTQKNTWCRPSFTAAIIFILAVIVIVLPFLDLQDIISNSRLQRIIACESAYDPSERYPPWCGASLVESIPVGLTYNGNKSVSFPSTFEVWYDMIESANHSIDIASFYWSLRNDDVLPESHPSSKMGEMIFQSIVKKGQDKGVQIRIVQNQPSKKSNNYDIDFLKKENLAEVRNLDFKRLVGAGILHTKFIIIDKKTFYLGSANMDWRALTQVKELGVVIWDCPCLTQDLRKIFEAYWMLGEDGAVIPSKWPSYLTTIFDKNTPYQLQLTDGLFPSYFSSSPPSFCAEGRTSDIDALLSVVSRAKKFIYIAVMDYLPLFAYQRDAKFWPVIDNALRTAALQRVEVRLLVSHWNHTRSEIKYFLQSIVDLNGLKKNVVVKAKFFQVPSTEEQKQIPYSRVNHNKYMVTDNSVFIGTSNWSADYFVNTGGVSFVATEEYEHPRGLRKQLESVFMRDWESEYAYDINKDQKSNAEIVSQVKT